MFCDNSSSADNQQERLLPSDDNLKWYLSGFTDGEGCFSVAICRHASAPFGWKIDPLFQVYQHKYNSRILYIFRDVLHFGYVSLKGGNPSCFVYCVDRISALINTVIPFFEQYPLLGEKYQNFLLFKEIVRGLAKKEHLSIEGFTRLTKLAYQMNHNGKYRKNPMEYVLFQVKESSEAKRQTR